MNGCLDFKIMLEAVSIILKHSDVTKEHTDFILLRDALETIEGAVNIEDLVTEVATSYKEKGFWTPSRSENLKAEIGSLLNIIDDAIELAKDGHPPNKEDMVNAVTIAEIIGATGYLMCRNEKP